MAASRPLKRHGSTPDKHPPDGSYAREDEKTIPFLRRLTDMLTENEEVISFHPGYEKNGQIILGRIVVHDRLRVEADVLPRYFNHASFASLRRQLNYFSFTRVGKGRQRGATYCNESVVQLEDILHLKRRSAGAHRDDIHHMHTEGANFGANVVPMVHSPSAEEENMGHHHQRRIRHAKGKVPSLVSPRVSPVEMLVSDGESGKQRITLDLTVPSSVEKQSYSKPAGAKYSSDARRDEEILAGCNALLSFSRASYHHDGMMDMMSE